MSAKLLNLLTGVIGSQSYKLGQQGEYMYWSPFISHHKPKLQVNIDTGKWHCWVSNNGGHNLFQLLKKLKVSRKYYQELETLVGETKYYKISTEKTEKTLSLPDEFIPLWNGAERSPEYRNAMSYLKRRGITKSEIIKYGIGYCEDGLYRQRVIVPSFDNDNTLNYFVGRSYYKTNMKYKNPPVSKGVVGFESMIDWSQPIVLCEGVFDAIAIKRNAIPLFGKTIPPLLMKKLVECRVKSLYLLLDSDAQEDSLINIKKLKGLDIQTHFIQLQDKDPSDLGFENILPLLKKEDKPMSFQDEMKMRLGF